MKDEVGSDALATASTLLANDTFDEGCPSRAIMDQVTTRWGKLVIASLIHGPHRFSQLQVRIGGISQKMLSHNLKALVRAGLVDRQVNPTTPPQVTYSLTPLGISLAMPLTELIHWFGTNTHQILEAQNEYDSALGAEPRQAPMVI